MGITDKSIKRLEPHLQPGKSMLQLGCQNLYFQGHENELAHPYFEAKGLFVKTIDITGCQGAEVTDLRETLSIGEFDIVTDFGTSEHVDGNYYQVQKNIHNACKVNGLIIHENPKTGHWPGHGCNYVDTEFYRLLAEGNGYEILELTEEYAMGNVTDGGNICVVLRKVNDNPFISEKRFKSIGHVFSS